MLVIHYLVSIQTIKNVRYFRKVLKIINSKYRKQVKIYQNPLVTLYILYHMTIKLFGHMNKQNFRIF